MSTPAEPTTDSTGDATQVGDTVITPVTDTSTDANGNTVVTGYPSGTNEVYSGTPGESPGGIGNDEEPTGQ
jgi:hypothetical protein